MADCSLSFPILQQFLGRGKDGVKTKARPLLSEKPRMDLYSEFLPHSNFVIF